MDQDISYMIP